MQELVGYLISGSVSGALYALLASGLVVSYAASGVLNLAHGAVAFVVALVYYELNTGLRWPIVPSAVVAVLIVAPLIGLILDRLMFRQLGRAGEAAQLVATIGLLVALPALALYAIDRMIVLLHWEIAPTVNVFQVPGLGPFPTQAWRPFGSVTIDSNQIVTFAGASISAVALWLVLRHTRLGLEMRATVDRRGLAALRSVDVDRTSSIAWMLSTTLAGLAGVLAAPIIGLNADDFTVLLLVSATAAVFARLRSVPVAFACGLGLGLVQTLVAGYADVARTVTGLRTSIPFILLLIGILVLGRGRTRVAGSIADDAPPPDYSAELPPWRRVLPWAVATVGLLGYVWFVADAFWVGLVAQGLALSIVFLSFVLVTGLGGMVSLAQASFVAAAALTAGGLVHHGVPLGVAMVVGAIVAAALGVVVALPAIRLGGRALALATLALAFLCDRLIFQIDAVRHGNEGWFLPRLAIGPFDLADDRTFVVVALLLVLGAVVLVRNIERSATGRSILAVRSAPAAAATVGLSGTRAKLLVFALSAALAGFGGVLYASYNGRILNTDFPPLTGFIWLAVVVTIGVRRPGAAVIAGLSYAMWPQVVALVVDAPQIPTIMFGLGGITLAKRPDGFTSIFGYLGWRRRHPRARPTGPAPAPAVPDRRRVSTAAGTTEAVLEVRGLVAGYGDVEVLHGVDLDVGRGSVVGLVGPNGAGKSTLCAALAGALSPSAGTVRLAGADVTWRAPHRRPGIVLVPEGRGIFPSLSVEDNLTLVVPDPAQRESILGRYPILGERRALPAGVLSGGEQQILSLAPLLVLRPTLAIVDEPSLGLAPRIVEQVFTLFDELRALGTSLLVVEEKVTEVLRIADAVVVIRDGNIAWSGPRRDVDPARLADSYLGVGELDVALSVAAP